MAEMAHAPSRTGLGPGLGLAYNAFLYASITDDSGAAPLNTVSVLARLDIDPWQEAEELARLPKDAAIQRLAALLARLPGQQLPDAQLIATRLAALLPGRTVEAGPGLARSTSPERVFDPTFVAIGFGLAMILIVLNGLGAPSGQPASANAKPAATSSASPPATPN